MIVMMLTHGITSETITISDNSETAVMSNNTHYTYENGYLTVAENNTTKWVYTYDESGNITEKKEYAVVDISGTKEYTLKQGGTDSYVYRADWKEELSSFNGQSFAYDDSGNPTTYRDHTLTWTFGRQLSSFGGITYTYDENGIRRSKTSNGKTTKYYTDSNNNVVYQSDGTTSITFYYDRTDNVTGFKYNGNNYFYVKNLQNDIVAITDSNGNVVVRYSYDPWGKIIGVDGNASIGNLNPFRYRSYYYDTDTDLYYLQSRYYDPEVCRFINCDNINYIGTNFDAVSYNPFAYCKNDPINYIDPTGTVAITAVATTLGVSTSTLITAAVLVMVLVDIATGGKVVLSLSEAIVMVVESVYDNIQFNKQSKKTKVPSKLKDGDKVKTPDSHPGEFQKNKDGSYTHKKTKWTFKKDRSNHYDGPHWDASPKNGKEEDYHNIGLEGKILT